MTKPTTSLPDKLGQPIKPGDFILYTHGEQNLSFGLVLETSEIESRWHSRIEPDFKVAGIEDWKWRKVEPRVKNVTHLPYSERILLANSFIPESYKDLLWSKYPDFSPNNHKNSKG